MSEIFVFYRRKNGYVFGTIEARGCPESKAIQVLDAFLEKWCGKHCDTQHGIPVFVGVPFVGSNNESILNALPRKLRRQGFEPHLRNIDARNGKK